MRKANRITCGCYCCRFRAELKLEKNMRRKESWKSQRQKKRWKLQRARRESSRARRENISVLKRAAPVQCRAAASALKAQNFYLKALASKRKITLARAKLGEQSEGAATIINWRPILYQAKTFL